MDENIEARMNDAQRRDRGHQVVRRVVTAEDAIRSLEISINRRTMFYA
jgi:hypothetical protein